MAGQLPGRLASCPSNSSAGCRRWQAVARKPPWRCMKRVPATTGSKGASRASVTPHGHRLDGRKTLVLHGDTAGLFLVVARVADAAPVPGGDRHGLLVEQRSTRMRLECRCRPSTRWMAAAPPTSDSRMRSSAPIACSACTRPGADAVEAALDAAIAALFCAEAVGAVDALLVQTAEHLHTRKQLGAPLAKFQVLQHRMADMAIALEQIKSMACAAAMALQSEDATQRQRLVPAAKVLPPAGRQIGFRGHPDARRYGDDR